MNLNFNIFKKPLLITLSLLVVFVLIQLTYNSSSKPSRAQEQSLEILKKEVTHHAAEVMVQLDALKEVIEKNENEESVKQVQSALHSREKICSLEEKDYIKKTDLNTIKSNLNENLINKQREFYLNSQKNLVNMIERLHLGDKYLVKYPEYVKSYVDKIKYTIDNYNDCSDKNIISASDYETFIKNYKSYEIETIELVRGRIEKDLANLTATPM